MLNRKQASILVVLVYSQLCIYTPNIVRNIQYETTVMKKDYTVVSLSQPAKGAEMG
jgi:hypothetical protein